MLRTALLVSAFVAANLSPAFAQTAEQRAACGADTKKYCDGVSPGGGRILDCLAKQKDKLSPACKQVVAAQGK